jgi:hypothetical protein
MLAQAHDARTGWTDAALATARSPLHHQENDFRSKGFDSKLSTPSVTLTVAGFAKSLFLTALRRSAGLMRVSAVHRLNDNEKELSEQAQCVSVGDPFTQLSGVPIPHAPSTVSPPEPA